MRGLATHDFCGWSRAWFRALWRSFSVSLWLWRNWYKTIVEPSCARTRLNDAHGTHALTDQLLSGVQAVLTKSCDGRSRGPALLRTTGAAIIAEPGLMREVFGPLGIISTVRDLDEMKALSESLEDQLTATPHLDDSDWARGGGCHGPMRPLSRQHQFRGNVCQDNGCP